jgi:hypothetical protein
MEKQTIEASESNLALEFGGNTGARLVRIRPGHPDEILYAAQTVEELFDHLRHIEGRPTPA